jgi:hypothetical protein
MNHNENENAMTVQGESVPALTTGLPQINYLSEVKKIQEQKHAMDIMIKEVLIENIHFGKVPGCGDKPALFKPGAEMLVKLFRLTDNMDTKVEEFPNGHREYTTKCTLYYNSEPVGNASGSCSTLETKYRYHTVTVNEKVVATVPKEFWEARKTGDTKTMNAISKGMRFTKKDGIFVFIEGGDTTKVENENIADQYNTCRKMAEKRALVAAVLLVTGASDKFTQDIEDMRATAGAAETVEPAATEPAKPATADKPKETVEEKKPEPATPVQVAQVEKPAKKPAATGEKNCNLTAEAIEQHKFHANSFTFTVSQNPDNIRWIEVEKGNVEDGVVVGSLVRFENVTSTEYKGKIYWKATFAIRGGQ